MLLWVLAFVLTAGSAIYQRMTGPTYPIRGTTTVAGHEAQYKLLRSHDTGQDARVQIEAPSSAVSGTVTYRRFRSHDDWTTAPLQREGNTLIARIPEQPAAGKVMYRVELQAEGERITLTPEPVIIRFKGSVPEPVLIAHIIIIFAGMFVSLRAGFEALRPVPRPYALAVVTTLCLVVGGLILGPVVQKYAFGAYWTGWPFGHDLTDNKLAAAVIAWAIAWWRLHKAPPEKRRGWVLFACVVTLAVWLIPHSVWGSELDFTQAETQPA